MEALECLRVCQNQKKMKKQSKTIKKDFSDCEFNLIRQF